MYRATYRLQLHKDFPLTEAAKIAGYLDDLGVSHLYLSPILEARPGSNHGYDGIDPTRISDERGGEKAFAKVISRVEKARSLEGIILDIVPNHLAASWRNPAWWDVLLNGPESKFWKSFDIRPRGSRQDLRIVLPVLGRSRQACVASRELGFDIDTEKGLVIRYWDNLFPVHPRSYAGILAELAEDVAEYGNGVGSLKEPLVLLSTKALTDAHKAHMELLAWIKKERGALEKIRKALSLMPLKVLEAVLNIQAYTLEDWRTGSREVNYRRFFDINDLAAVRVEDSQTFDWAHSKLTELAKKYDAIHGFRVDHIDGLTDPQNYIERLRKIKNDVWVEKILHDGESVPPSWPIAGTTGYEFLGVSARLFVDLSGLLHLHAHYTRHIDNRWERFHDCLYDSKREILETHFVSEFASLSELFFELSQKDVKDQEFTKDDLSEALKELTSSLRVYRTYFVSGEGATDLRWLQMAFAEVEGRGRLPAKAALNWLRHILLEKGDWSDSTYKAIKRWEQLTGPVMAKGLEDTALYRYFPLLSLNGVGCEPDWVGDGVTEFHAFNQERMRQMPLGMNTTSTHDTKRSEDVRSRIHVISELSEEWVQRFSEWHELNGDIIVMHGARPIPDLPTEYLIYEALLGAWPMNGKADRDFVSRMKQYILKASREAKAETSWIETNSHYEDTLLKFIDRLMQPKLRPDVDNGREFLSSFKEFVQRCTYFGAFNSLSSVVLKTLSPGLPDFYQGCELWDLSMVDPDNRRAVDFELRRKLLKNMKTDFRSDRSAYLKRILGEWRSGEVKLFYTREILRLRQKYPELFIKGEYLAIDPVGEGRRNLISFMRCHEGRCVLVVAPRLLSLREKPRKLLNISDETILSAEIPLPRAAPTSWRNHLTGKKISATENRSLKVRDILGGLPCGVITAED